MTPKAANGDRSTNLSRRRCSWSDGLLCRVRNKCHRLRILIDLRRCKDLLPSSIPTRLSENTHTPIKSKIRERYRGIKIKKRDNALRKKDVLHETESVNRLLRVRITDWTSPLTHFLPIGGLYSGQHIHKMFDKKWSYEICLNTYNSPISTSKSSRCSIIKSATQWFN